MRKVCAALVALVPLMSACHATRSSATAQVVISGPSSRADQFSASVLKQHPDWKITARSRAVDGTTDVALALPLSGLKPEELGALLRESKAAGVGVKFTRSSATSTYVIGG